jgi:hypothetical protein
MDKDTMSDERLAELIADMEMSEAMYPGNSHRLDLLSVLRAEQSRRLGDRAAPDWQPIETAPKDGTDVLITDGEDYAVAHFDTVRHEPCWRDCGDMGWAGMIDEEPTHWMPLPPAPGASRPTGVPDDMREDTCTAK